jgi:hypothetical protein
MKVLNVRKVTQIAILIFSVCGPQAQAVTWQSPRKALDYPFSFHTLMSYKESNSINSRFPKECGDAVQKVLSSGGNFSTVAIKKYVRPLSEVPSLQHTQGSFYHYTDWEVPRMVSKASQTPGIIRSSEGRVFSPIFDGVRQNPNYYFYIAGNPESSKSYGKTQYTVKFALDTKVYHPHGLNDELSGQQADQEIEDELIAKYPDLQPCKSTNETWQPILADLSAEAEGVGIKAYIGVTEKTQKDDFTNMVLEWYMVLGEWAIQSFDEGPTCTDSFVKVSSGQYKNVSKCVNPGQ